MVTTRKPKEELTAREERFVGEYVAGAVDDVRGNGVRSAIAAGYSTKTAKAIASELLRRPRVKAAIKAAQKRIAARLDLSAEKTLGDIARVAAKAEASREYGAALKGHELIGKYLKLFTERHEHSGVGGGPVLFQITEKEADL